jgi:hypothetical protein
MHISASLSDNLTKIRPLFGIGLVVSVALLFGYVAVSTVEGLVQDLDSALPEQVQGELWLNNARGDLHRGDSVSFYSEIYTDLPASAYTYLSVVCVQRGAMVEGKVGPKDATFTLGASETGKWGAGDATCSASLMVQVGGTTNLVDSLAFVVTGER